MAMAAASCVTISVRAAPSSSTIFSISPFISNTRHVLSSTPKGLATALPSAYSTSSFIYGSALLKDWHCSVVLSGYLTASCGFRSSGKSGGSSSTFSR
jgi:hypothetical protein